MARRHKKHPGGRPTLAQVEARAREERDNALAKARERLAQKLEDQFDAVEASFVASYDECEAMVGDWMEEQGFNQNSKLEMIALMHSELSEAVEAIRKPRGYQTFSVGADGKVESSGPDAAHVSDPVAEELADCIIRIMHYGSRFGHNVSGAIVSKCIANLRRPFKHGKLA